DSSGLTVKILLLFRFTRISIIAITSQSVSFGATGGDGGSGGEPEGFVLRMYILVPAVIVPAAPLTNAKEPIDPLFGATIGILSVES
ncbi:hypothetical protein DF186_18630, partial [Enterococcus hirae]